MLSSVKIRANIFGRVRYSWYCRPLAIVLALLLLGPFPELPDWSLLPRAEAQTVNPCVGLVGQSKIIQATCVPVALENNAVAAFLRTRGIPATEAHLLYQYGGKDVRSELRADIYAYLVEIIKKIPAARTSDEQVIYDWFQGLVWAHEKEQYAEAKRDRDLWKGNPCGWRVDPVVAEQYNLNYDPSRFCANNNNLSSLFSVAPAIPTRDYFLAVALKNTYGLKSATTAGGTDILGGMLGNTAVSAAIAAFGGLAAGGLVGAGLGLSIFHGVIHLATGAALPNFLAGGGGIITTQFGGSAIAIAGPIAIVVAMAVIGAVAAFKVYEHEKTLQDLQTLDTLYTNLLAVKPDLAAYINHPVGAYKLQLTFSENTIPDFPSTAVPPGRRAGDRNFVITPQAGSPMASSTFTYKDWEETRWTAGPSGGWITGQGVKKDNSTVYEFGV